jgi:hypothetical protein
MENDTMTINTGITITARVLVRSNVDKIFAIKTLRQAAGIGLREAKDIIEYRIGGDPVTVDLTAEAFGHLTALCDIGGAASKGLYVKAVAITTGRGVDFDLT